MAAMGPFAEIDRRTKPRKRIVPAPMPGLRQYAYAVDARIDVTSLHTEIAPTL